MTYRRVHSIALLAVALMAMVTFAGCRPAQPPTDLQAPSEAAPPESAALFEGAAPAERAGAEIPPGAASETGSHGEDPPEALPVPPVATAPERSAPILATRDACGPAREAPPATLDAYKRDLACHIHARNGARLYDGAPPPMLRSVVVLSLRIDAAGRPVKIRVLRSNGIRELERRAVQSVRDAAPLPLPGKRMLRKGIADITETWLFRDDGRFQVRTLALVQATSGY